MALSQRDEAFLWVGVELFPSLILSIDETPNSSNKIAVLYIHNERYASISQNQIAQFIDYEVVTLSYRQLLAEPEQYAAFFITDPKLHTARLSELALEQNTLTFSPFPLAVQHNIDSGLLVRENVRPQVNIQNLKQKNIKMKPFFMKISDHYE